MNNKFNKWDQLLYQISEYNNYYSQFNEEYCIITLVHVETMTEKRKKKIKGMFGNYVFPLFSIFKNNFIFLRLKNLFDNPKWTENKNCFQISTCEGN